MNKKGGIGIVILVIVIIMSLGFAGYKYISIGGEVYCEKTPEDVMIFRLPLSGTLAGGKQTGAESHTFVNGETISVCCADVVSGPTPEREFKDCIHYDKEGEQDYQVVWEKKDGDHIKIKEYLPWQGYPCTYSFDELGDWTRYCGEPETTVEPQTEEEPEEKLEIPQTPFPECDNLPEVWDRDECYAEKALEARDITVCDYISSKEDWEHFSEKFDCYSRIALYEADPSICDLISDDSKITDQKDRCYLQLIGQLEDASFCEDEIELQRNKDSCYCVMCTKTGSYCENIVDENKREVCSRPI